MEQLVGVLAVLWFLGLNTFLVPLGAIIIFSLVYVLIKKRTKSTRFLLSVLALLVYYLILYGDTHAGKLYVKKLCRETTTFAVYETVQLPNSYWDNQGWPKFHKKNSSRQFIPSVFNNKYKRILESVSLNSIFEIKEHKRSIIKTDTGAVLVYIKEFTLYRGWLKRYMSPKSISTSYSCGWKTAKSNNIPGSSYNSKLASWVFVPQQPLKSISGVQK